jgi:UDP-glucose 4-epimerase
MWEVELLVAVTGGGGFIGKAVTRWLRIKGHEPRVLDLPEFDVKDIESIFRGISGTGAVIHLAGVLGTHELFDTVDLAIDTNIKGTANVLESARLGGARYVGITMPKVFPSIYTATKLGAEALERAYHHTYGVPVSRVRAFNAYGPGQKHGHNHPRKIVPTFATEAWRGRPIPIWGDGEQTVDLVYVDDLGRMLVDALNHGDDMTLDGGTGYAATVNEVAQAVLMITGSKAGIEYLPMRRGESPTKIVASGEGWDRIDWRPQQGMNADFLETVRSYR